MGRLTKRIARQLPSALKRWWNRQHAKGVAGWFGGGVFAQIIRDALQDRRDGLVNTSVDWLVALLTGRPNGSAVINDALAGVLGASVRYFPIALPLAYIAITLERARRDELEIARVTEAGHVISEGWLQDRLIERFNEDEAKTHVEDCLRFLQIAGIFWQTDALQFLDSEECKRDLLTIYREELSDPTRVLDPYGYCFWGPRLYHAPSGQRSAVIAHLRVEIRKFYDRDAGKEMTEEQQIKRQIARLQGRLEKLTGPMPPTLRFGAPEDRAHEGWLVWWHIPISLAQPHPDVEDCRVTLRQEFQKVETVLHWSRPTGPAKQVATLKYHDAPLWVPIALRSEQDCTILGFAVKERYQMLTDAEAFIAHRNYTYIQQVLPFRFRIVVHSEAWEWVSAIYQLDLPEFQEANKAFRMQRTTSDPSTALVTATKRVRNEDRV